MTLLTVAALAMVPDPTLWKRVPTSDSAAQLLKLIREAQPNVSDLPEGSTYNYIWAENMMAWMVAERSGLMSSAEVNRRLRGLLGRVSDWETHHGFYFDAYDPATGKPTTENVYFQGWWLWALILTREAYPQAAPLANRILERLDYDRAGMIDAAHGRMAADRNAKSGKVSFYIDPTGDISGELRTPLIAYTWLTGDDTPWRTKTPHRFIQVGGESILAVWHHFTFDPFFVHSTFPETGYFAQSFERLKRGAEVHRKENGMTFYATRMDPLEAWRESPGEWPNTEHRVAKPWTAWLTNPAAPVMERAWVPGYGVVQLFDNWNFRWGAGPPSEEVHPKAVAKGADLAATFKLETVPGRLKPTHPARLRAIRLRAFGDANDPPKGPLVVKVNDTEVGRIGPGNAGQELIPSVPLILRDSNRITLETEGGGRWRFTRAKETYRPMEWAGSSGDAIELEVVVDGQRMDRENPFAFICRTSGAFGNYPWKLLLERKPADFGDRLVAWVGPYSSDVTGAHRIYNVGPSSVTVTYQLSAAEARFRWTATQEGTPVRIARTGQVLSWAQDGYAMVRLSRSQTP